MPHPTPTVARTRAVAYVRVSTDKQATDGASLDAQRAKLEDYARLYDLDLVAIEVDAGESAGTLERPGLKRALAMLRKRTATALVVVKLDRLTRSVTDLGHLVETYFKTDKRALLSVTEQVDTRTASGRMVLNVLTSIGQWEREAIGERTAAVKRHLAAKGRYLGGDVPFGYVLADDGETLVEVRAEQAVIAEAAKLRAAGLSHRGIAATLAERGRTGRDGRPPTHGTVQRWLATSSKREPGNHAER